jgi:DNA-binding transcriptional LysR family regulator
MAATRALICVPLLVCLIEQRSYRMVLKQPTVHSLGDCRTVQGKDRRGSLNDFDCLWRQAVGHFVLHIRIGIDIRSLKKRTHIQIFCNGEYQMDLVTLAVFCAVAKEQSITRAAELVGRVPSNVTTRIQQLESDIGVALFQRETRRMVLTPEGETFLDYVERILNMADEARQVVNPTEPLGVLRLGSMEATAATRLPVPLAQFNAKYPKVKIDLITGPTRQLVEALLAHRIDCALVAVPADEWWLSRSDVDMVPMFREELVLLLPPGHPEVERPEDVRPESLAAFAPGCTYRMLAEEWLTGMVSSRAQHRLQEVRSYHAMVACVAAGTCFSILPRAVLDSVPHNNQFTIKPLMTSSTYLVSRPGYGTAAFKELCATLADVGDFKGEANAEK